MRVYGWDYVDRLAAAGFEVDVVRMEEELDQQTIDRCRLAKFGAIEPIFLARRARA